MSDYLSYIERIMGAAEGSGWLRGKPVIKVSGKYVYFWRDDSGAYLDGLQYSSEGSILWTWSKPGKFYEEFISGSRDLTFELHSFRKHGEPKLKKPIALKGIRPSLSIDYIANKCRCSVFLEGDNVWIKHGDYFSETMRLPPDEVGAPLGFLASKYAGRNRSEKFVYTDAWGSIVLRNEAWICIRNLRFWLRKNTSQLKILRDILRQQEQVHGWSEFALDSSDMERFFERLISVVAKEAV